MKNYKLTIFSILLSCCFITSIQLTATASTQPNGKDIAIDDLPTVDRSIAETIADALGLGDIFQGVLDFLEGIENTNDKILEVKTPDWNIVKDAIEDNDTRGKELGRQLENRDTDSFSINRDEAEQVQRLLIQDAVSTSTTSTEAVEATAASLVELEDALKNISLSNNARDEVDRLLAECNELTGDEALQCMEQQVPEIQKIADAAEANDPITNSPAAKYAKSILSYLQELGTNVVNGDGLKVAAGLTNTLFTGNPIMMAVIKVVFGGIQLAFNFALEVAGILHALLLPLVIAVVFTPIGSKYVETWIKGYVQLVLIKFLYIAVIGLAAEAIVRSEAQYATGVGFLIFSSVMGPALAFYMARGGADIAKFVSSKVTSAMSNAVQNGAALATGGASKIGTLAGKSLFNLGKKGLARRTTRRST